MHFFRKHFLLILIGATCLAYFSSLTNPFIWDDEQFITKNIYVQTFNVQKIFTTSTTAGAGIITNYYRPVTTLSFAIDTKIWGMNTFGFHLGNLIFHTAGGILLFFLLSEIGISQWGSFLIALIFLVHPVQTEAVTYINSRGDSLYTLFLFGSLLVFFRALQQKHILLYIGALVLYVLSIFSKETAIAAFPLYFVLIVLYSLKTKHLFRFTRQSLVATCSSVCIVILYVLLRMTVLNFDNTLNYYSTQNYYSTHLLARLFTFARVLWVYMGIILWPYPLHMERSVTIFSQFNWEVLGIMVLILACVGLSIWEIRKGHTGFILFGFALASCLLIPVSGIIPINGILYEHWLYMPLAGLLIMLYGVWKLFVQTGAYSRFLIYFAILLSILYIVMTIQQNNIWADPVAFYKYTLSFAPQSARLHNNLGMSLADRGDVKLAIVEYKKALILGQGYPQIYNNLGNAEIETKNYQAAEKDLQKALELAPHFTVARNNLIRLYLITKQYDKARKLSLDNPAVEKIIQELEQQ